MTTPVGTIPTYMRMGKPMPVTPPITIRITVTSRTHNLTNGQPLLPLLRRCLLCLLGTVTGMSSPALFIP